MFSFGIHFIIRKLMSTLNKKTHFLENKIKVNTRHDNQLKGSIRKLLERAFAKYPTLSRIIQIVLLPNLPFCLQ